MKLNASVFSAAADRKALLGSGDEPAASRKDERKKKAAGEYMMVLPDPEGNREEKTALCPLSSPIASMSRPRA